MFLPYIVEFFFESEMLQAKVVQKIKTKFYVQFFSENSAV